MTLKKRRGFRRRGNVCWIYHNAARCMKTNRFLPFFHTQTHSQHIYPIYFMAFASPSFPPSLLHTHARILPKTE